MDNQKEQNQHASFFQPRESFDHDRKMERNIAMSSRIAMLTRLKAK